jgi:hypothetical protein
MPCACGFSEDLRKPNIQERGSGIQIPDPAASFLRIEAAAMEHGDDANDA